MNAINTIMKSKGAKRFLWTCLNVLMGMSVVVICWMITKNPALSATLLPVATAFSQYITKTLNTPNSTL